MSYIGTWKFHSIGVMGEEGLEYLSGEAYLNSPMPYIDETDEEEVAAELRERKSSIGMQIKVCEGGKLYLLLPIPEEVPQEEIDMALQAGEIQLMDGMLCNGAISWEERDGELWFDTGIEGEAFGEPVDSWTKAMDDEGFFTFITTRFVKAD